MKKLKKVLKDRKGFTLVELITVIVILGILMVLVVPTFNSMVDKAKKTKLDALTRNIYSSATALVKGHYHEFRGVTNEFPITTGSWGEPEVVGGSADGDDIGTELLNGVDGLTLNQTIAKDLGLTEEFANDTYGLGIRIDASGNLMVDFVEFHPSNNLEYRYASIMYKSELMSAIRDID